MRLQRRVYTSNWARDGVRENTAGKTAIYMGPPNVYAGMWKSIPQRQCKDKWFFNPIFLFFLFKLFIYVTLQHCIGFAIHWLESTMGVRVFPILNPPPNSLSHPSGSSQCTSLEHPVSCIKPGLAIFQLCKGFYWKNFSKLTSFCTSDFLHLNSFKLYWNFIWNT